MERQNVAEGRSSAVLSIGYDEDTETLEIELASKAVYQYLKFPEAEYAEFIKAQSLGQFMASRIRGAYEYKRLHSDGRTRISKCEDPACWCMKLTKSWYEPKEKPSEKEKPKKADKKTRKIS